MTTTAERRPGLIRQNYAGLLPFPAGPICWLVINLPAVLSRLGMKAFSPSAKHRRKYVWAVILFSFLAYAIVSTAQRTSSAEAQATSGAEAQATSGAEAVARSAVLPSGIDPEPSWERTELYYGAGRLPADGKADTRWEDYLDNEVTPRFPDGLTLLEGSGQWRVKQGEKPRRNRTRILVIIHKATPENSRKIEEIRTVWKAISGHESVLRVTLPADVSF